MRKSFILFAFIMLFTFALYPCDNKREGFILGAGLGFGFNYSSQTLNDFDNSFVKPAFMADIKIGGTFKGGYHSLFLNNKETLVFNAETASGDDETLVNNLISIAYSYHFKGNEPEGFYLSGGLGLNLFHVIDDIGNVAFGPGIFAEAGYEFHQHFSAAFFMLYADTEKDSLETSSFITGILINAMLY